MSKKLIGVVAAFLVGAGTSLCTAAEKKDIGKGEGTLDILASPDPDELAVPQDAAAPELLRKQRQIVQRSRHDAMAQVDRFANSASPWST